MISQIYYSVARKQFSFLHHICLRQVCGVEFDRKDVVMNKLVATTLESKFHVYDLRTQHPEKGFASLSEKVGVIDKWPRQRIF